MDPMDAKTAPPTILVALDGSPLAEQPLGLTSELVRRLGGRLLLVSVPEVYGLEPAWYGGATIEAGAPVLPIDEFMRESREATESYLAKRSAEISARGIAVATVVGDDSPAEAIAATATGEDAVLVVMATHGRRGLSRWAFGSVADKVLHITSRPVLLVRSLEQPASSDIRHLMVALDGSRLAELVLPTAQLIARAFGARITLVHVIGEPDAVVEPAQALEAEKAHLDHSLSALGAIADRLRSAGIDADGVAIRGQDIAETLLAWQQSNGADLVALTTHGRSGLRRWAFGCIADRLLSSCTAPVLLQRIAED
jgi:nucleotide-binding universal stress UspA family protein